MGLGSSKEEGEGENTTTITIDDEETTIKDTILKIKETLKEWPVMPDVITVDWNWRRTSKVYPATQDVKKLLPHLETLLKSLTSGRVQKVAWNLCEDEPCGWNFSLDHSKKEEEEEKPQEEEEEEDPPPPDSYISVGKDENDFHYFYFNK